jgi:MFS transporter, PHS family, inorganic phosphate transporter
MILVVTFLILALLFAITGGTLITSYRANQNHMVTTVFYGITQFVINIGPNTLTFVLAAEIFPTVYRGTFYGIAAATGKVGAIIIRAIIGATKNLEMALAIRILVFVPLMLIAAAISWLLPDVQHVPRLIDAEALPGAQIELFDRTQTHTAPPAGLETESRPVTQGFLLQTGTDGVRESQEHDEASSVASASSASHHSENHEPPLSTSRSAWHLFWARLDNKTLEEIAPNPVFDDKKPAKKAGKEADVEENQNKGGSTAPALVMVT